VIQRSTKEVRENRDDVGLHSARPKTFFTTEGTEDTG
jgi:hypothetical protein